MLFNVCDVFYSLYSQQHISAAIGAIFRVTLLLQKYIGTIVVNSAAVTPKQLKIIIISVKII
jgi:hypothetical protein